MAVTFQSTPDDVGQIFEGLPFTALVTGRQSIGKTKSGTDFTMEFNSTNYNLLKNEGSLFVRMSGGDLDRGVFEVTSVSDADLEITVTVPSDFDDTGTAWAAALEDVIFRITGGIFDADVEGNKADKVIQEIAVPINPVSALLEFDVAPYLRAYSLTRQTPSSGYDEAFNIVYRVQEIDAYGGSVVTSDEYHQALFGAGEVTPFLNAYTSIAPYTVNQVDKDGNQLQFFATRLDRGRRLLENIQPSTVQIDSEVAENHKFNLVAGATYDIQVFLDGLDNRSVVSVTRPSVRVESPQGLDNSYSGVIDGYVGIDDSPINKQVKVYRGASPVGNADVDPSTGKWSYTASPSAGEYRFILEQISPVQFGAPWEEVPSATIPIPSHFDFTFGSGVLNITANLTDPNIWSGGLYSFIVLDSGGTVESRIDIDVLSIDDISIQDCREFHLAWLNINGGWSSYTFKGKRLIGRNVGATPLYKDVNRIRRTVTVKDSHRYVRLSTKLMTQTEVELMDSLRTSPLIYAYNSDTGEYDIPVVLEYGSFPLYGDRFKKSESEMSFTIMYAEEAKIQVL